MKNSLLKNFLNLNSFEYNSEKNSFVTSKEYLEVNIDELLNITSALDNSAIPYKIVENFEIKLLSKKGIV